jgi:TetR/AcrR family transcriptional repressor of nem operon
MLSKAERTKQFILEKAAPLFNEKGVSGVSIDDVLAATKLTKGCLYGHFESKEDLSAHVVDLLLAKTREQLLIAVGHGKTAKAKIFAYLDFYKDPLSEKVRGGCPIFNIAVEADDNYPAIKEKIADVLRNGQEEFAAIVKYGVDQGEFSKKIDPSLIAFKFVAAIEGALVMCRVMNTAKPMQALVKSLKAEIEAFER